MAKAMKRGNPALLNAWESRSVAERKALARRLKTSYRYLQHVCHGRKRLGWANAKRYAAVLDLELAIVAPEIWGNAA